MSRAADMLQARAETLKLARLLGCDPARLAYLERLPPEDLRALRDGVTETLYDAHGGSLRRLAAASRLLPSGLTASIGQRAFGPLLSARLAGLLETDKAVEVAGKLPPPFLADVAVELDPRRAEALIAQIAPALIGQVTAELVARREYVTMGRFVGHLGDAAIAAALGTMDDEAVLQVAFVLEDKAQISRLLGRLAAKRAAGILAAAARGDLWLQALDLLNHLSQRQRAEMVTATLALEEASLEAILDTIIAHDLWDEVLLIAEHDDTIQQRLAQRLTTLPPRATAGPAGRPGSPGRG
ncbi:MAG TPA: hypothetical protein VGH67_00460 [Solirubrobacteraceae bacterium]|jgi:hypothetical protein